MLEIPLMTEGSREALRRAINRAGGLTKLAAGLDISVQAVSQWEEVPPLRVLAVERMSGVSRHELRPDLYPPPLEARA